MSNDQHMYDVVVVGAGPAGSMAARYAAEGGCSVALLDRKVTVGIPVRCGEGVGLKGLSISTDIKAEWILTELKTITFVSPDKERVKLYLNESEKSFILDRTIMDADLVLDAEKKGVHFYNKTNIISIENNKDGTKRCISEGVVFIAKVVVLADGVESRLARFCGWNDTLQLNDLECGAFCHVSHPSIVENEVLFHTGTNIAPGGYLWVFPRASGLANVGLGVLGSCMTSGLPKKLLFEFIKREYPGAVISHFNCGGVPVGKWRNPLVRDNVILVGDAARQVNALNGGGIAYSLYAGRIAGETIGSAFTDKICDNKKLKLYQKRWAKYCGKQQLRSYALKMVLIDKDDEFYDSIAHSLKKENPRKLNYLRIFMRTFRKYPHLLWKTFMLFR